MAQVTLAPSTPAEVAEALSQDTPRRIVGGATKQRWGAPCEATQTLSTTGLNTILEHTPGDFTAILQAGVPLKQAQERFAAEGQMIALDPPYGADDGATIGGVVATADSGPLRHRYGGPRDLVIGITIALPDGTVAKGGGKVIKNVAGYDLPKLFSGSFGTLGVIVDVAFRLHPLNPTTATAVWSEADPRGLGRVVADLARRPLEADALDVAHDGHEGRVLARFSGSAAEERAEAAAAAVPGGEIVTDDGALWQRQRDGQRAREDGQTVVRVSALPTALPEVLRAGAEHGATSVGRAVVGVTWLTLPAGTRAHDVDALRERLAQAHVLVLDAPDDVRRALDPWDAEETPALELQRRVKARFDPHRRLNPGIFMGGI